MRHELLSELENRAALYYALLYHDVGKGIPDEGHVDASLRICEGAMDRISMPERDREMVRYLIGKHLALSATDNAGQLNIHWDRDAPAIRPRARWATSLSRSPPRRRTSRHAPCTSR